MSETVKYFGYGANRDPKMIAAITGKTEAELVGQPAVLEGFGLAVQSLEHVPDTLTEESELPISARELLHNIWGDDFRSYVTFEKKGARVAGTIWELTPDDRERIRDWELVGDWYKDNVGIATPEDGRQVEIITETMGEGQHFDHEVNGLEYETWLQPSGEFEAIAAEVRREYDERNHGGPEGAQAPVKQ